MTDSYTTYLDELGLTSNGDMKPPRHQKRKKHPEEIIHEAIAGLFRRIIGHAGESSQYDVFWISHENKPRSMIVAVSNMRRGVKAGFPDVEIIYEGHSYFGEIKVPKKGRLQESQKAMHQHLMKSGAPVDIWFSTDDALASLVKWRIPHLKAALG